MAHIRAIRRGRTHWGNSPRTMRAPVHLRTGALGLSVLVTVGSPLRGNPGASLHPQIPYEDVTSTEPTRLLSNGSPPPRGYLPWRDPTLPNPPAARAVRARAL